MTAMFSNEAIIMIIGMLIWAMLKWFLPFFVIGTVVSYYLVYKKKNLNRSLAIGAMIGLSSYFIVAILRFIFDLGVLILSNIKYG
jgi:hypothetical protein